MTSLVVWVLPRVTLVHVECGNWRQYVKKGNCLWLLVIAQTYGLDRLETACIKRTKRIKFAEFKKDNNFDKISAANYRKIVEGMLQ